ncbi:histidine kinase [Thaumasiovibrio sp. DFM-14]|uniref:histidine kinase n=1 Tax=Thaumasiovibrio sp. DFM-14 TaxID=3384792 RepID=UPI0039A38D49
MTNFFYYLSHQRALIVTVACLLASILSYLIYDGDYIRHFSISCGYGLSFYFMNSVVRLLFPYWNMFQHQLVGSLFGIIIGSTNAALWVYGRESMIDWSRFLPIILLAVFFAGIVSFMFYLKGQAVTLESEVQRHQLVQIDLERRLLKEQSTSPQTALSPDFLYRIFNSIYTSASMKPDYIKQLSAFSMDLLRITQSTSEYGVTLRNEVAFLRTYLDIHKIQTQQNFRYHIEVDDNLSPMYFLPANMLYPLIESVLLQHDNAETNRQLFLRFRREFDRIEVTIESDDTRLAQRFMEGRNIDDYLLLQGKLSGFYGDKGRLETDLAPLGGSIVRLSWKYDS